MHRPLLSLFLILLLYLPFSLLDAAAPLSLAELMEMALKHHPETARAWAQVERAQARLGIASSSQYPTLDASAGASHAREVKYPNGPNTTLTSYNAELNLSYLLFDFGERRAAIRATKEALKAANWSADFAMQSVMSRVAGRYYEYLHAATLQEVQESTLKDALFVQEATEELQRAGLRSVTDLTSSRAVVAQFQMDLAQQHAQVAIAHGALVASLGLPIPSTSIEVDLNPEGIQNPLFAEQMGTLIAVAEKQRADLLAKNALLAERREEVRRAQRAPWPKLRAMGQSGYLEYAKHEGSGYNYCAGVGLEIPLFKGFEYRHQKRLAVAEEEVTTAELRELQESIALDVLRLSESAKAAHKALKWSDIYLEEALHAYEGSLENYRAGLQSIFDLLQAQKRLADARMKRATARTQWLVSLAELAFATGSTLQ